MLPQVWVMTYIASPGDWGVLAYSFNCFQSPKKWKVTHHLLPTLPMEQWVKILSLQHIFGFPEIIAFHPNTPEFTGCHFFNYNLGMIAFCCNNHESLLIMCCSHANDAQGKHSKFVFFYFSLLIQLKKLSHWLWLYWFGWNLFGTPKTWLNICLYVCTTQTLTNTKSCGMFGRSLLTVLCLTAF